MKPKPTTKPKRGGARPGAGRPRTRPDGARKVHVVLSPAAAAEWDACPEGNRSAWVSALIEQAAREEREAKTRECPLVRPAIPDGWACEAGMYVSRDGDAVDPDMLRDPQALAETVAFLRRMTALVEWVQRNQALDAFEARRAARQTNPGV